ncbi:MAG TPA: hypothetical protein VLA19_33060 [Herpetosiphonaceae bacterium]|nr:hypothetical protein [Herpetosiphonaceae bacterium]
MANATVAQSVNRSNVGLALQAARAACAQHPRWLAAVNRAALNLEACRWQFDGDVLVVHSATTPGTRYTVTADTCTCKAAAAGRPCWHRAAHRLLVKASGADRRPEPARCPSCGAELVSEQAYIGGIGYCWFLVCPTDHSHYTRRV